MEKNIYPPGTPVRLINMLPGAKEIKGKIVCRCACTSNQQLHYEVETERGVRVVGHSDLEVLS
jgi:hypothetical protein